MVPGDLEDCLSWSWNGILFPRGLLIEVLVVVLYSPCREEELLRLDREHTWFRAFRMDDCVGALGPLGKNSSLIDLSLRDWGLWLLMDTSVVNLALTILNGD